MPQSVNIIAIVHEQKAKLVFNKTLDSNKRKEMKERMILTESGRSRLLAMYEGTVMTTALVLTETGPSGV